MLDGDNMPEEAKRAISFPPPDDGDGTASITSDEAEEEQLCAICLDALPDSSTQTKRSTRATQLLAAVKPCGHHFHDFCIKSWSERANTCPTCRSKFNSVSLLAGDKVFEQLSIADKVFPVPEEEFVEEDFQDYENEYDSGFDPDYVPRRANNYLVPYSVCILCDEMSSSSTGLMVCNSCSGCFHPYCLGNLPSTDSWTCPMCDATQSADSIIPPTPVMSRQRRTQVLERAPPRALNSFIFSLRDEIRTNRRNVLGLPFEPISRRQRSIRRNRHRSSNNNNNSLGGMFLPPPETENAHTPVPQVPKEETDAWRLYDGAKKKEAIRSGNSSRQATPVVFSAPDSSSVKKVKKPVRKKHKVVNERNTPDAHGSSSTRALADSRPTAFRTLLSTINNGSSAQRPIVNRAGTQDWTYEQASGLASHSSIENSPNSGTVSSDDEDAPLKSSVATSPQSNTSLLTADALAEHDSRQGTISSSATLINAHDGGRSRGDNHQQSKKRKSLSLSQKHLLQKLFVRSKLRTYYNNREIDADTYTEINKSVSRKLYKQVEDHEIKGDYHFIVLLNKLLELRERYEYESFDDFAKRIISDSHTSTKDRDSLNKYSNFVSDIVKAEVDHYKAQK